MSDVRITVVRSIVRITKVAGNSPGTHIIVQPTAGAVVRVSRFGIQGVHGQDATGGGGPSSTFVWSPPSAIPIWVIPHNMQKFPSVTVVDSDKRVVLPDVTYLDNNLVELSFAFPMQGQAFLN